MLPPPLRRARRLAPLLVLLLLAVASSCRDATGPVRGTLRSAWVEAHAGYARSQPVVVGDVVYAATGDGEVVARARADGRLRWVTPATWKVEGSRMLAGAGLVIATGIQETVALDAASGAVRWRFRAPADTVDGWNAPGQVTANEPAMDATTLYVPAWGASVSAVDLATGATRWTWQPARAPTDTAVQGVFRSGAEGVTLSGDTVYVTAWHFLTRLGARAEPWLVALDRATGRELWRFTPGYAGQAVVALGAPAVAGRLVLLTARGGLVWAVDRFTREVAWTHAHDGIYATEAAPVVIGDMVLLSSGERPGLVALALADGTVRWRGTTSMTPRAPLAHSATHAFPVDGQLLYVVDLRTGRVVQELRQPKQPSYLSFIASSPVVHEDEAYVGVDGALWGLRVR